MEIIVAEIVMGINTLEILVVENVALGIILVETKLVEIIQVGIIGVDIPVEINAAAITVGCNGVGMVIQAINAARHSHCSPGFAKKRVFKNAVAQVIEAWHPHCIWKEVADSLAIIECFIHGG